MRKCLEILIDACLVYALILITGCSNAIVSGAAASVATNDVGTSFLTSVKRFFIKEETLKLKKAMVVVCKSANRNRAIRMHIVVVFDKELFKELSKKKASEYFKIYHQLAENYDDRIRIFQFPIPSREYIFRPQAINYEIPDLLPEGALVFANYCTPGDHRIKLKNDQENVKIILEKNGFKVGYIKNED